MGWGVGCHSWSHGVVMDDPDRELRQARETIEDAIGRPVTVYTSPGTNDNLTPDVQEKLREYGYLAGLSITDDINYPPETLPQTTDLRRLRRRPPATESPEIGGLGGLRTASSG